MIAITARFVEFYIVKPGTGITPAFEAVETTWPPSPCFSMRGTMVMMPFNTHLES
jgi:hypothetical protein